MERSETASPPIVGPRATEDAAVTFVIEQEAKEGRSARDTRYERDAVADLVSGHRIIEVKAAGNSSRGHDLWLEPAQFHAARQNPNNFWLYLVDNVRQGDPGRFRLLRLSGRQLSDLLAKAKHQDYFTVPVPVAVHDALSGEQ